MASTISLPLNIIYKKMLLKGGLSLSTETKRQLEISSHSFLHQNEQIYCSSLYPQHRFGFMLGRHCAKQAIASCANLGDLTKVYIEAGAFQQPIIINPILRNTQISISHTNTIGAAVAFPESLPMGIDIERICTNKIKIIENLLSLAEKNLLPFCKGPIKLTKLWTIKEALSKALKCGLTIPFNLLEIEGIEENENISISYFKNFTQYQASSFFVNDSICSIVYPKETSFNIDVLAILKTLGNSNS